MFSKVLESVVIVVEENLMDIFIWFYLSFCYSVVGKKEEVL